MTKKIRIISPISKMPFLQKNLNTFGRYDNNA